MYKRSEYQVIMNRLKEQRKFIQVVMGTRQIGKPMVIKQVLKDSDMKKRITTYFIGILALATLCSGCSTNRMAAGDPGAVLAGASIGGNVAPLDASLAKATEDGEVATGVPPLVPSSEPSPEQPSQMPLPPPSRQKNIATG